MIKALIIDDERNGAEVLKMLIEQNIERIVISELLYNVESGIEAVKKHKPDLVFLDIEMPDGTGFDVIEATKGINYQVIFTTAYEQYAIKALKAKAINYLLKPIDLNELVSSVEEAIVLIEKNKSQVPANLEKAILDVINRNKKIPIPSNDGIILIDVEDIIRLEADSNYTNIFLQDGKKILASKTLRHFEEMLINHHFLRVHSAHIINLDKIERYIRGDGGTLVLIDGKNIPVSRSNKIDLLQKLGLT